MHRKMKSYLTTSLIILIFLLAAPLSPATAETQEKVTYETGFYYTVQPGDTLWDLSRKFSDTPWQWPEMWQENDQIANPHRIYPGERIRLYRRRVAEGYGEAGVGENGEAGVGENGEAGVGENGEAGDKTSGAHKGLKDKPELEYKWWFDLEDVDGQLRVPPKSQGVDFYEAQKGGDPHADAPEERKEER